MPTRHARALRHTAVAWLVACVALSLPAAARAQKLVFVVRHAERADAGGAPGQMMTQADPPLSAAGTGRAEKLAAMLASAGITAIYTTEFRRTQDTARPLAQKLGLQMHPMAAADTAALVAAVKRDHPRDVVLIVSHGNTVSDVLRGFGGPAVTIGDNDYDNLFVIVPATGAMARLKF